MDKDERQKDRAENGRNTRLRARRSINEMSTREKINLGTGRANEANRYYGKISKVYRALKILTLFVLMGYLGVTFAMYHSEITYENLMYLIKDLDTDTSRSNAELFAVTFEDGGRYDAELYRDRLALCTSDSMKLYSSGGKAEYSYTHSMESPTLTVGDKYILAYDTGGTSYSIYTTIARVLTKQSDGEISLCTMAKSGEYAIVTRARENKYVVNIYDRNFRETSKIYKDKYVMSVSLSDDGKNYCIASFDVENAAFVCEVMSGSTKSDKAETVRIENALPLKSGFFSDGSFAIICDSCVLFFDSKGALTSNYGFGGTALSFADVAYGRVLTVEKDNVASDVNRITLFDKNGNVIEERIQTGKISYAALGEKNVFEAVSGTLCRYCEDGSFDGVECALGVEKLIPSGSSVLVCTSDGATPAFIESNADGNRENAVETANSDTESSDGTYEGTGVGKADEDGAEGFDIDLHT